jgi:hypothetical protein
MSRVAILRIAHSIHSCLAKDVVQMHFKSSLRDRMTRMHQGLE